MKIIQAKSYHSLQSKSKKIKYFRKEVIMGCVIAHGNA